MADEEEVIESESLEQRLARVAGGDVWRLMICFDCYGNYGITIGLGGEHVGTVNAPTRAAAESFGHILLTNMLAKRRRAGLRLVSSLRHPSEPE